MFIDLFKEHGLPIELNWGTAAEISRNGAAKVTFNSGKAMETSLVIAATGVAARLSFLKDSGIAVNQGRHGGPVDEEQFPRYPGCRGCGRDGPVRFQSKRPESDLAGRYPTRPGRGRRHARETGRIRGLAAHERLQLLWMLRRNPSANSWVGLEMIPWCIRMKVIENTPKSSAGTIA